MVTADAVWRTLEEIPDPEIPVISLVDLGVVKRVDVSDEGVRVEFTPTFMGCPALDAMTRAIRERVEALGAPCEVLVVNDDSWSTDRISAVGREKLRAAGFAPPPLRSEGTPSLVQLERGPFRCPWCGSTETRLENIFGPTACRSIRYCTSCSQPFEQFKTI
ncbi:MAG: phenylacetate-CoA oxygenase subunit PaaJ [Thermoleophilia bacterium]|nr:phenylacetate-CoA oxygenase subunit PaaJ [Thermoleophilia bacterium]MDH4345615.1 phenylacetate-CoA oxygenase subunit PaaJ [Thermoleophilia bacterium]